MLTIEEQKRYHRQLLLPEIGEKGQERLRQAKVLVVGAGGLGSPVLQYLGAAGVGNIGIVDADVVSVSNLQRQILYRHDEVGQSKAQVAAKRLQQNNPHIITVAYNHFLTVKNALEIIKKYDLVVDCTDNFGTRYLINDATVILSKPWVHGSIFEFTGQVAVFNYNGGATYRCLYPEQVEHPPKAENNGVMGALAGWVGCIQANEAIKLICKLDNHLLSGRLLTVDALACTQRVFSFPKSNNSSITVLEDIY